MSDSRDQETLRIQVVNETPGDEIELSNPSPLFSGTVGAGVLPPYERPARVLTHDCSSMVDRTSTISPAVFRFVGSFWLIRAWP